MLDVFSPVMRAAVIAATSSFSGLGVYADLAQKGAKLPYIIISVANATTPNRMRVQEGRVTFNVQAMVDANESGDPLASEIASAVFDYMTDVELELVFPPPWSFYRLEHLTSYRRVEVKDTQRFAYAGGLYLLEADRM